VQRSLGASLCVVMTLVWGAAALTRAQGSTTQVAKSVWSGVYTEEQAKGGEALYVIHCAECHGETLDGMEEAPALYGTTFVQTWNGTTLRKMFERLETMPPSKKKSLTAPQYAELLAYLLSASKFPAGSTPLEANRTTLAEIAFTSARPK
jgi:mono/diheme cytochrome c family protein